MPEHRNFGQDREHESGHNIINNKKVTRVREKVELANLGVNANAQMRNCKQSIIMQARSRSGIFWPFDQQFLWKRGWF